MTEVIDVSPTRSNTNASDIGHSVVGRIARNCVHARRANAVHGFLREPVGVR